MSDYQEELNYLKSLPIFKMSLGSKELFHSNFLEFLWEIEPDGKDRFFEMLKMLSGFNRKADAQYYLEREKEHFDLCLYHIEGKTTFYDLVIENKVKSIPRKDQLDLYKKEVDDKKKKNQVKDTILLLLSLVTDFPCKAMLVKENQWIIIDYLALASAIEKEYKDVSPKYSSYIDSYVDYCRHLHSLQGTMTDDFLNQQYFEQSKFDSYQGVRLGDLYLKVRGSLVLNHLKERLQKHTGFEVHLMPFVITDHVRGKKRTFKYTDIRGIISNDNRIHVFLECTIQQMSECMVAAFIYRQRRSDDFIYEVVSQGKSFRHGINSAIESKRNDTMDDFWKAVHDADGGFLDNIWENKLTKPENYNKYGKEYVYRYVHLEHETVSELLDKMEQDILFLVNKLGDNDYNN